MISCGFLRAHFGRGDKRLAKAKIKRLYLIPILSKALDVIELLEQHHAPLVAGRRLPEDAHLETSVYRILKTLAHRGYLPSRRTDCTGWCRGHGVCALALPSRAREMPFSVAVAQSVTAAAAASGWTADSRQRYDADIRVQNAEEFVAKRVDCAGVPGGGSDCSAHCSHFEKSRNSADCYRCSAPNSNLLWRG